MGRGREGEEGYREQEEGQGCEANLHNVVATEIFAFYHDTTNST